VVPTLRPGDAVILDNLPSRKDAAVRELIKNANAKPTHLLS
jgi:hypothetical protein